MLWIRCPICSEPSERSDWLQVDDEPLPFHLICPICMAAADVSDLTTVLRRPLD